MGAAGAKPGGGQGQIIGALVCGVQNSGCFLWKSMGTEGMTGSDWHLRQMLQLAKWSWSRGGVRVS